MIKRNKKGQFKKGFYQGFGFQIGHKVWNKGKSNTWYNPKGLKLGWGWNKGKKMKIIKNYSNGYDAIHDWVERWIKKLKKCENCGIGKNLQWANKSGKYRRNKNDWLRLCVKCHQRYDYIKFGARKAFYEK